MTSLCLTTKYWLTCQILKQCLQCISWAIVIFGDLWSKLCGFSQFLNNFSSIHVHDIVIFLLHHSGSWPFILLHEEYRIAILPTSPPSFTMLMIVINTDMKERSVQLIMSRNRMQWLQHWVKLANSHLSKHIQVVGTYTCIYTWPWTLQIIMRVAKITTISVMLR